MINKKIYGVPISVTRRIKQKVDASNDIIIQIALTNMQVKIQQKNLRIYYGVNEDWHAHHKICGPNTRGCGCIYCRALAVYVSTKIAAHRLRKQIDSYNFGLLDEDIPRALEHLKLLDEEWPRLRTVKNQIKTELGM